MNVLGIDTSGPVAGVALVADGRVIYEGAAENRMTHSVNLLPMTDEAFLRGGLTIKDIDLIAVTVGPGSFTGVRIGVSTVKGLSHGAHARCVGVDALEALASGVTSADKNVICPIQDARAGQVYGAAFFSGMPPQRLCPDMAAKLSEYLDAASLLGEKLIFVGDGAPVHRSAIEAVLGPRAVFPPAHMSYLRPSCVALLGALRASESVDYLTLMPRYLRAPQAERARAARGGAV